MAAAAEDEEPQATVVNVNEKKVLNAKDLLAKNEKQKIALFDIEKTVNLEYDLARIFAFDPTEVTDTSESTLQQQSRHNVQLLFQQLYNLPKADLPGIDRYVQLPKPTVTLPREKPIPKPKELSRWEKFRRKSGIRKRKRSKMEWDEDTQSWKRRWGKDKANDLMNTPVVEFKEGHEEEDPWSKEIRERKEKVAWNKNKQAVNLQAAAGKRLAGTIDLPSAIEASTKNKFLKKRGRNKKDHVDKALEIVQSSTVSMGKFDKKMKHEPKIKRRNEKVGPHKTNFKSEKASHKDVLNSILGRNRANKEKKAVDKNKLANIQNNNKNKKVGRAKQRAVSKFASKKGGNRVGKKKGGRSR